MPKHKTERYKLLKIELALYLNTELCKINCCETLNGKRIHNKYDKIKFIKNISLLILFSTSVFGIKSSSIVFVA